MRASLAQEALQLDAGVGLELGSLNLGPTKGEMSWALTGEVRANAYVDRYGFDSWELDALEPAVIDQLVRDEVIQYRDDDLWGEAVQRETEERDRLQEFIDQWEDTADDAED